MDSDTEVKNKRKWSLDAVASYVEASACVRIWVKVNQCMPIFAFSVALGAAYFAYSAFEKSKEDKKQAAWQLLLSSSGKKVNFGQVSALEKLHSEDSASFSNIVLTNTVLRGAGVTGADFHRAELSGSDLTGSILQGADFSGAKLKGSNFSKADLAQANFNDADLTGANLSQTMLHPGIVFARSLRDTNLTGAKFVMTTEDDEDGERRAAFIDSLGEPGSNWKKTLLSACVSKSGPPPDFGAMKDYFPKLRRTCNN